LTVFIFASEDFTDFYVRLVSEKTLLILCRFEFNFLRVNFNKRLDQFSSLVPFYFFLVDSEKLKSEQ